MRKQFIFLALLAALMVSVLQADHFSHSINVSALDFDGVDDRVQVLDDATLRMGTEDFTIEAWVKGGRDNVFESILDKEAGHRYVLGSVATGHANVFVQNGSGQVGVVSAAPIFPAEDWVHVAGTISRADEEVRLYVNGVFNASASIAILGNDPIDPTSVLRIGNRPLAAAPYEGQIDEVRVWKGVARTEAQINATKDKELIGNEAGLVAYWKFDEDGGSTAFDDSQNSNDGTITGATYITDDLPHLTDSQYHNLSPEDEVPATAGEIPAMERRDTDERQRSLPLMGRIGDVEDSTGYSLVRLTLALMAGGFILFGAWFFSQLSPENPVVAWAFILIASLLAFGFGAIGWVSFICIALYSSGIVAFRQSTPA